MHESCRTIAPRTTPERRSGPVILEHVRNTGVPAAAARVNAAAGSTFVAHGGQLPSSAAAPSGPTSGHPNAAASVAAVLSAAWLCVRNPANTRSLFRLDLD